MKKAALFAALVWAFIFSLSPTSCWALDEIQFSVFSDVHYYDSSLGTTGSAFEDYLMRDRKLLRESEAILQATLQSILSQPEKPQFVLVPGDLTKDGERLCHEEAAAYLRQLENNGINVYVVPGNHDVNNPDAHRYLGDFVEPVETVSPEQFARLYADFGYSQALSRDPGSLSYVAEPASGLWLFALDSCIYEDNLNLGTPVTAGRLSKRTLNWVFEMLSRAKIQGKKRIGLMHHGLVEHYTGQSVFFSEYLVQDWQTLSWILAKAGMQMVFTGHYHAQDAVQKTWDENGRNMTLFDVETGSLVTFPNPYRIVTLRPDNVMAIQSRFITDIDYDTGDKSFPEYSEEFTSDGIFLVAFQILTLPFSEGGFGLDPDDPFTAEIADEVTAAILAHYKGDEKIALQHLSAVLRYLKSEDVAVKALGAALLLLWKDLAPKDTIPTITLDSSISPFNRIYCASLGDNPNSSTLDMDTFTFRGHAGETVTIRLNAFPLNGGNRKRATLVLKGALTKTPLLVFDGSALPNELTATLPASGLYTIKVSQQPDTALGTSYVGDYFIELEASAKTCQSLAPTSQVE
jgi:3',5'-cyclic AMP phosphodiesterase CpdA